MGFRVQLIAITGKEPTEVHHDLGVSSTGEHEEHMYSPVVGTLLHNGRYLLYIQDRDMITEIIECEDIFPNLSKDASFVGCYVCEMTMCSYADGWTNGVKRWSIFAQQGNMQLEKKGILPSDFQDILKKHFEENGGRDDDVFDIPVKLFVALGGIRYDCGIESVEPKPWEVLRFNNTTSVVSNDNTDVGFILIKNQNLSAKQLQILKLRFLPMLSYNEIKNLHNNKESELDISDSYESLLKISEIIYPSIPLKEVLHLQLNRKLPKFKSFKSLSKLSDFLHEHGIINKVVMN